MDRTFKYAIIAFLAGSAILLVSCSGGKVVETEKDEGMITLQRNLFTILKSENGIKGYRFEAPLLEGYGFAKEPYQEYRKGIFVETYNDSTQNVESTLVADYAIHFEKRQLWELKGNVKMVNANGQVLETQQLFWNERTRKIYSNIDTRITQGNDVLVGIGFESDEALKVWEFRSPRGRLTIDAEPNREATEKSPPPAPDSLAKPAAGKPSSAVENAPATASAGSPLRQSESRRHHLLNDRL